MSDLDAKDYDCDINMYVPVIITFLHCKHCPCDVEVKYRLPMEYNSDQEQDDESSVSDVESASI